MASDSALVSEPARVRTTILRCIALGFIALGGTVMRTAAWETKIKEGEVEPSSV